MPPSAVYPPPRQISAYVTGIFCRYVFGYDSKSNSVVEMTMLRSIKLNLFKKYMTHGRQH